MHGIGAWHRCMAFLAGPAGQGMVHGIGVWAVTASCMGGVLDYLLINPVEANKVMILFHR